MREILDASLQLPTVIFTVGLGIALVYWVFVLLGALDIDLLGGGDASGADGLGHGADAGAGADAGHGHGHGHAVGDHGGFWNAIGIASVPITISLSVIFFLGWIGSLLGMRYLGGVLGGLGGLLWPVVLLAVVVVGVPLAGQLVRPLAPLFVHHPGKSNRDYVGATCTITTGHVDAGFGQATVEDGGTVLTIPVRCDRQGALSRGQQAVIIEFDGERQAYVVEPAEVLTVRSTGKA